MKVQFSQFLVHQCFCITEKKTKKYNVTDPGPHLGGLLPGQGFSLSVKPSHVVCSATYPLVWLGLLIRQRSTTVSIAVVIRYSSINTSINTHFSAGQCDWELRQRNYTCPSCRLAMGGISSKCSVNCVTSRVICSSI